MAVNVNTVYQTVLYILNKEQRGYVTPAEFNSLATQVQDEIFQSYFPDGNQLNRKNQNNTQNDTEFFDMFKDISYKLYPFEKEVLFTYDTNNSGWVYNSSGVLYKIGEIIASYTDNNAALSSIVQLASKHDYSKITRSKLTSPSKEYPLCLSTSTTTPIFPQTVNQLLLKINPQPNTLSINSLFKPSAPSWGFTIGPLGQYLFAPSGTSGSSTVNFELDISEKNNIIINVLKYCGIIINDPTIIQMAEQQAQKAEINEKS
jgi:hypothetical protein